ncbi:hypothetical protein BCS89_03965 [Vibrio splendidus]|nr:hypothetical protein BCS97_16660 [Vibrio splendidus]PMP20147.1 hypothetical protein BCS89_03965 [Vibrio splendidus]PMP36840.1 hypothetical protein BCS88_05500 [Vibrio splendidus]PMP41713.1 hypothetical protein BCS87_05640 [Vibrio splendidus]PMP45728.1 hypothetical protein BCS85_16825 [Vibrio splendidus]
MLLPALDNKGPILVARDLVEELLDNDQVSLVKVYYLDNSEDEISFSCETELLKKGKEIPFNEFDIIHSHTMRTDYYLFRKSFNSKRKIGKCNFISTIHQYNFESFYYSFNSKMLAWGFAFAWNLILTRHDMISVLTKDMKAYYRKRLLNKNIVDIYNGKEVPNLAQEFHCIELDAVKTKYSIIGTACSLTKTKGLEQVIETLPNFPNLCFVVLGEGPEIEALLKVAEKNNVKERCMFLGFKPNALDYYKYFDTFVLPSRNEGFGLALIEAASLKVPIICSAIPTFKELFTNKEVSFFELDNDDSLRMAIEYASSNKLSLSNGAYEKYIKSYTRKRMGGKYYDTYKSISK